MFMVPSLNYSNSVLSSIFLTLQLVSLAGTFLLYFTSDNSSTQREVITKLYHKTLWKHFRRFITTFINRNLYLICRSNALQTHALIAVCVQTGLVLLSILLLVGITKRRR